MTPHERYMGIRSKMNQGIRVPKEDWDFQHCYNISMRTKVSLRKPRRVSGSGNGGGFNTAPR